ncbi:PaaI family thioesterase [Azospirillum doebereinerae]|uniref:Medium/long-chain acyl-CoA thioesterase YigI n=1 Tax=Azospirillum doebereinerae TaxID=92933 RepID=A0A3S0XJ79_9PROT|nr:PaaI family thioesterase [Azospirillum doebereinerae]MCG5242997.1 PaaI family thioesterase [Azospirillum doebereinerae]RUQ65030.1 PaaI family thioesterase [Azospirillum doebereinerae]
MSATFEPRDPDWEARCLASFEKQPICKTLGIELTGVEPGFCEMRIPFRADLTQQHGFFHAGMVSMLADNAGGYAAYSLMPAGAEVLAVEFKINLMAPAKGDVMVARARVVKSGRTLTVCQIEVAMIDGGVEKDCALMQQTTICLLPT